MMRVASKGDSMSSRGHRWAIGVTLALAWAVTPTPCVRAESGNARLLADWPAFLGTLDAVIQADSIRQDEYQAVLALNGFRAFLTAYGDPSSCYRFEVTNPSGSGFTTVNFDFEIPLGATGPNTVRARLDVELVDADQSGTATITRRNGVPGLQRALVFQGGGVDVVSDLGEMDLSAPGSLHFEGAPSAGVEVASEGTLGILATFDLSEGDTAILSGQVVVDDGSPQPVCRVPILFDGFETGDLGQWSSSVGAAPSSASARSASVRASTPSRAR